MSLTMGRIMEMSVKKIVATNLERAYYKILRDDIIKNIDTMPANIKTDLNIPDKYENKIKNTNTNVLKYLKMLDTKTMHQLVPGDWTDADLGKDYAKFKQTKDVAYAKEAEAKPAEAKPAEAKPAYAKPAPIKSTALTAPINEMDVQLQEKSAKSIKRAMKMMMSLKVLLVLQKKYKNTLLKKKLKKT